MYSELCVIQMQEQEFYNAVCKRLIRLFSRYSYRLLESQEVLLL